MTKPKSAHGRKPPSVAHHFVTFITNFIFGCMAHRTSIVPGSSMDGRIGVGPLFLMQKKSKGWNVAARDWNYVMIMPNGAVQQSKGIQKFCNECHQAAGPEDDYLMFLPDQYRVSGN